jgi:diguanylate cyclase
MFDDSAFTIIAVLIAVGHLLLGTCVGWWLKERRTFNLVMNGERARGFLGRLHELTTLVSDDIGKHTSRLEEINQDLTGSKLASRGMLPEGVILDTVSQLMVANKKLRERLTGAEQQLHVQANQIDVHLSEARRDSLTALPNRRAFDNELSRRFAEWQRTESTFSLLLIEIDQFKELNDRYGNLAGDLVLRTVAATCTKTMREMDLVTRYAAEQFAFILPSTNLPEGTRAAERAREAIESLTIRHENVDLKVTTSAGIAEAAGSDNVRTLFRRADAALFAAKEAGGKIGYFHDGAACHPIMPRSALPIGDLSDDGSDVRNGEAVSRSLHYAQYVSALGVDARTDVLTGLPNRRAFGDELRRRVSDAQRTKVPLSLLLVGVNHLNKLNAFHGQEAVDQVLRKVAQVLCAAVRDSDLVTRYGWEEFAVILGGTTLDEAQQAKNRVLTALAACTMRWEHISEVTISSGITELQADDDSDLFAKRADLALQTSKAAGGNCVHLHPSAVAAGDGLVTSADAASAV